MGTQHIAVTRCATRYSCRSTPSSADPGGLGTSVAPAIQGTQISSTEKSKAIVIPWYIRSPARTPYTSAATRTKLQMLPCSTATPLGRPVDPEV